MTSDSTATKEIEPAVDATAGATDLSAQQKGKIIRDPLHDLIRIDCPFVLKLIETRAFQRLRKIRQLGLAFLVYPGAEHSRFTHSVGAYHLSMRVVRALKRIKPNLFTKEEEVAIGLAALCHDIGHGPFSHLFERVTESYIGKKPANHETWTLAIIEHDKDVSKILKEAGNGVFEIVRAIIDKTYTNSYVKDIVSSQLDVDRFDYLMRDSMMCGVKYGTIDLNWLIRTLKCGEIDRDSKKVTTLALDGKRGLASVESYILGRYYMYIHVYYHKTIRAAETMLRNLLKEVIKETANGFVPVPRAFAKYADKKVPELEEYLELNDFAFLNLLDVWAGQEISVIQDLARRLVERRIFATLVVPENLAYDKRQEREAKAKDFLRDKKLSAESDRKIDPDIYFINDEATDVAYKDYYFQAQRGKEAEHQEIYYLDANKNTKSLSSLKSFVNELTYKEERIYVPKEYREELTKICVDGK